MVVGSPERIARLDAVKTDLQRLADPRGVAAGEQDRLVREAPVVVWLAHGVHGNEISSSDAALLEAYHLLAAQGDPGVETVLRDALVLIDPMQNPDGRARFVFQHLQGRAAAADPTPYNAEHDEPWPGGRSNHYLFDMNRDWFAQTQPETRGRIQVAREYWPHVNVDLHEQGGDNTYYFAPPADPLNPHITKSQIAAFDLFGRANGQRFDERGWPYFIREVYDSFYPGYGESWPIFQGSIGMTYEQASARGLSFARSDGTTLTYRDGVMHHFNAAIVTAVTAARNRERLVRDFLEYRRSAVAEGEKGPVREYVLVPGHDPSRAALLAKNLATQGIEVRRTTEAVKVGTREVPAGAYVISHAQPSGRLIRNLLDPHIPQPDDFIERQEARRARRQADQIYDITAWSLPLLYDVEVVTSAAPIGAKHEMLPTAYEAQAPVRSIAPGKVGYLVPWGSAAAGLTADALAQGIRMHSVGGAFTLNGRRYPIGTALIRSSGNPADLHGAAWCAGRQVRRGRRAHRYHVRRRRHLARQQRNALPEGAPGAVGVGHTHAVAVGRLDAVHARAPFRPAGHRRARRLARPGEPRRLRRHRAALRQLRGCGDRRRARAAEGLAARRRHVDHAGRSHPLGHGRERRAARHQAAAEKREPGCTRRQAGAGSVQGRWGRRSGSDRGDGWDRCEGSGRIGPETVPQSARFDYDAAIKPDRERPDAQPGAILRVIVDTDHWLSAGQDAESQTMIEGSRVFAPLRLNSGRNVGIYAAKDRLIASGLIWPENQDLLVQKAFLMHQPVGQGHVIAFAEDANYRAFSEATMLLFMNAVLLGPSY